MNIGNFINQYGGNLARPTKFTAILNPPESIPSDTKAFDILCKTVSLPEITHVSVEAKYKGHTVPIPARTDTQHEVSMTFYLPEDHQLRKIFYDWIRIIDSTGEDDLEPTDKFGSLTLLARDFSESNEVIKEYSFENVYPTVVGSLDFNSSGSNEIMEFSITFTFLKYT